MLSKTFSVNLDNSPAYWFLSALHLLLAQHDADDCGYSLIHLTAPSDFETPYHLHLAEDEAFYVLEGEVTVIHGEDESVAGPGSYVFLPRGVPHGFRNAGNIVARLLIHVIPGNQAGFVGMMLEMAVPVHDRSKLPEATPPDFKLLNEQCNRHGINILGPLPMSAARP